MRRQSLSGHHRFELMVLLLIRPAMLSIADLVNLLSLSLRHNMLIPRFIATVFHHNHITLYIRVRPIRIRSIGCWSIRVPSSWKPECIQFGDIQLWLHLLL